MCVGMCGCVHGNLAQSNQFTVCLPVLPCRLRVTSAWSPFECSAWIILNIDCHRLLYSISVNNMREKKKKVFILLPACCRWVFKKKGEKCCLFSEGRWDPFRPHRITDYTPAYLAVKVVPSRHTQSWLQTESLTATYNHCLGWFLGDFTCPLFMQPSCYTRMFEFTLCTVTNSKWNQKSVGDISHRLAGWRCLPVDSCQVSVCQCGFTLLRAPWSAHCPGCCCVYLAEKGCIPGWESECMWSFVWHVFFSLGAN